MNIDTAAQDIAIARLASSIIKKILRAGQIDVDNCNKIVNYIHLLDTTNGPSEPITDVQKFSPAPELSNLQSRIQMAGRNSYLVLQFLMSNPGSWYTPDDLANILGFSPGSTRVHIYNLRKALLEHGLDGVVNTRYRIGYSINFAGVDKIMSSLS